MQHQQTFNERYQGFEFDWFALDTDGNIALLASGGLGKVPTAVQQHYQAYDLITQEFVLPHLGSLEVWQDYASYGFYVFDWVPYQGPYQRVAIPHQSLAVDLYERIWQIQGLPRFDISFKEVSSFNISVE